MSNALDQTQRSSWRVWTRTAILAIAASVALLGLPSAAAASDPFGDLTGGSTGTFGSPTISSDKADYSPGETVVLTGTNWLPGEHVHIVVNDSVGQTWFREADVTADAGGSIRDEFQLPTSFIAEYAVTATGDASGTAQTTFTDGNVKISLTPSGVTAAIRERIFDASNCGGNLKKDSTATFTSPATDTVGIGNNESVRLDAPSAASTGQTFLNWSKPAGSSLVFTVISGTGGQSVCVQGFQSGNEDISANYAVNTAPTVARNNATVSVNEGQTATNTGTWADANPGDTVSLSASVGTVTKNADGTWSWSYATTDGPEQTQTVTIAATDNHNASTTTTFQLNVANVAPAVTAAANQAADEGTSKSLSLGSFTDPGNDGPWAVTVNWGDGSSNTTFTEASPGTISAKSHTYADNGSYTVTVTVAEAGTAPTPSDSKTFTVTVANVAPAVTAAADQTGSEGTGKSFSLGSFTDPGDDGPWAVTVSWGDGSPDTTFTEASAGAITAKSHSYADDGVYTVAVKVAEAGTAPTPSDMKTFKVTVANVPPAVTAADAQTADEGTSKSFSLGSFTDPGDDGPWAVKVEWGDGSSDTTFTEATSGAISAKSHSYADDGEYTVKVTVSEAGTAPTPSDSKTFTVTVANVPPAVTAADGQTADEGTSKSFSLGSFTDPGDDGPWAVKVEWGDGSSDTTFTEAAPGPISAKSHTYSDDGEYTVKVTVSEAGTAPTPSDTKTFNVTVANVSPAVTVAADQTASEGTSKSVSLGSFTDPGDDGPWAVKVEWGDGSSDTTFTEATPGAISAKSHTYADDGEYTVKVTVSEAGTTPTPSDSKTFKVTVDNVAPTVTFTGGPTNVNEDKNGSELYTVSVSDPGTDGFTVKSGFPDCGTGGSLVSGSLATTASGASFRCRFSDGPASPTVRMQVRDADEPAGSSTADSNIATRGVTVNNVAPVVNLTGPDAAEEGDTKTYTFTLSDPGDDTFTFVSGPPTYPSCGAHGELVGTPAVADGSFQCRFPDGPNTTDVAVKVKDDDGGISASDVEHVDIISVSIANVAPTLTAPADQSSDEGENKSFALGSFSDPGPDSPWAVDVDWGDGSTHTMFDETAAGPVTDETVTAHSHAYADNGSYVVTVTVTDKNGDVDSKTFQVTVKNVAPTVTLSGPVTANEGDTKSYSYTWTDPGSSDTFPAAGNSVACGPKGTASDKVFTPASKSGSFKCTFSDDSGAGTFAVNATVTDDDGGARSDTKNVDVDNVAPTASNGSFVFDPVLGTATAGFDFTDPGTADTHGPNLSYFTWSDVGDRFGSVTETNGSGHASDTRTLSTGCYNLTVTGRAKDDDLGMSAALPIYSNSQTSVNARGFRPPIVDNERNIVKYGNVVPVKVALTNSCTGAAVTNVSLYIGLVEGSGGEVIEGNTVVAESVSAADTTGQMRIADGMYMYNLATKNLTQGKDYSVRIRLGSSSGPIILAAVLQPKK
jgi:hypothetical protein